MARLKNPLFSQSAVGQIGGLLYRDGTYGTFVSRRSIAPSLRSPLQTTTRSTFVAAGVAWNALTDAQRASWENIADYPATGRNQYVAAFTKLGRAGLTPAASAPVTSQTATIKLTVKTIDIADPYTIRLAWTRTGAFNAVLFFYHQGTWSNRATPKPRKLTIVGTSAMFPSDWAGAPPFGAPVNWLRADILDRFTGRLLGSTLVKLTRI